MIRHLQPLHVKAHFNVKSIFIVLIDNGSVVNIMSVHIKALGRNTNDWIKTEVSFSAFTKEISKTLGILPIDLQWTVRLYFSYSLL